MSRSNTHARRSQWKASAATLTAELGTQLDPELLVLALTHRSFAHEAGGIPTNERLEFLGDTVLGLVVTEALYRRHPDLAEGELAKMRAATVSQRALAAIARQMDLGRYVLLGKGELATGGRNKDSILADTLEALFGAVYLTHGLEVAREVVQRLVDPTLAVAADLGAGMDWKTSVQELAAQLGKGAPEYACDSDGPDHARTFTARIVLDGQVWGTGTGSAKKIAEQEAAATAYEALNELSGDALEVTAPAAPERVMPELPEVETVRSGLARHVLDRTVTRVEVRRESTVRRNDGGADAFADHLLGRTLTAVVRRGKFLWLLLDDDGPAEALLAHLGMSGQMLVRSSDAGDHRHLRARLHLSGDSGEPDLLLDFIDQRTFGHLSVCPLVPTADGAPGGRGSTLPAVPLPAAHIARDLLDPYLDRAALVAALRRRRTGIKRALLDQTLVSGVGNIYADEALWRARMHGATPTSGMRRARVTEVLDSAERVMSEALLAGGTSFDSLYVNVNGASGYFDRSLAVYGQAGRPCPRCGTEVLRERFMNRSSCRCPQCQPVPPAARLSSPVSRVL